LSFADKPRREVREISVAGGGHHPCILDEIILLTHNYFTSSEFHGTCMELSYDHVKTFDVFYFLDSLFYIMQKN